MSQGPYTVLISSLPPTREQKRTALAVALLMIVIFAATLPFAGMQLGKFDSFIPIVATVMFLIDSITATLLFAQFAVLRTRSLLILASGYLFTALIVIPYALTFPGAFEPTGLLGAGMQSAPWLFTVWHIGLPATIIAYVLLSVVRNPKVVNSPPRRLILASMVSVVAIVCVVTWLVITLDKLSPVLMRDELNAAGGFVTVITWTVLTLCALAVTLLWFHQRSMLDLWLLVVSLAWLLDSALFVHIQTRYSIGWYANRAFGISAASLVLFVLLSESTMLYARLALSVLAQRRAREGRLMTLDALSGAIAHEMKQPIGAIVAHANAGLRWLKRPSPDYDEACESFAQIVADGHRASEVIQSVRELFSSREQAVTEFDANELIRETVALVRTDLDAAGISVRLGLAAQLPPIQGHHGQLQQVLMNLATNAAEAMGGVTDRARVLTMRSDRSGPETVAISVEDSGSGVDPKNVDHIFEPFFTTKSNGMGMGLALCRSIVEAHGGTLSVSPVAPHGSVFRIVVPYQHE